MNRKTGFRGRFRCASASCVSSSTRSISRRRLAERDLRRGLRGVHRSLATAKLSPDSPLNIAIQVEREQPPASMLAEVRSRRAESLHARSDLAEI